MNDQRVSERARLAMNAFLGTSDDQRMSEQARRALDAHVGPSSTAEQQFIVILALGPEGLHALAQYESKLGPLVGRVVGMIRPCRLELRVTESAWAYLFGLPDDIVSRARMRNRQGLVAPNFGFAVKSSNVKAFRWVGEEPQGKQARGVSMDAYSPPQLSREWVCALIEKPSITPYRKPTAAVSVATASPISEMASPSRPSSFAGTVAGRLRTTPQTFALRVVGEEGRRSLASVERRFGRVPANIKCGGPQQCLVFPISPDLVSLANTAQGEIAPGLFLEREKVFLPSQGLAPTATTWLKKILSARKK